MTEEQLRDLFSRTDTDKDGFITREVFISETIKLFEADLAKATMGDKETAIKVMRKTLEEHFPVFDSNEDGKLSLDEALIFVRKPEPDDGY